MCVFSLAVITVAEVARLQKLITVWLTMVNVTIAVAFFLILIKEYCVLS